MNKNCKGLASVQCCNFDIKNCKYRTDEDDCCSSEVVVKALKKELAKYSKPLRTPDKNGVLELTKEELEEISKFFDYEDETIKGISVFKNPDKMQVVYSDGGRELLSHYKAVQWILNRFNLGE